MDGKVRTTTIKYRTEQENSKNDSNQLKIARNFVDPETKEGK